MYIRESLSIKNKYNKYNPRKNIPDNDKKSKIISNHLIYYDLKYNNNL